MIYTAKENTTDIRAEFGRIFELFEAKTVKDMNDNDVTIPQSIGIYSLEDLNREKDLLTAKIAEIDIKISAINDLLNQ